MQNKIVPPLSGTWRPTQTMGGKVIQWALTCPLCGETVFIMETLGKTIEPGTKKMEPCPKSVEYVTAVGTYSTKEEARKRLLPQGDSITEKFKRPKLYDERFPDEWPMALLKQHASASEAAKAVLDKRLAAEKAEKERKQSAHA